MSFDTISSPMSLIGSGELIKRSCMYSGLLSKADGLHAQFQMPRKP